MTFLEKIQTQIFWKNVLKIALPFFIIVTIISLFINSSSAIFSGNFKTVVDTNFSEDKWQSFWGFKIAFSLLYGIWQTHKNS